MPESNNDQIKLNIRANIDEVREYYNILKTKYQHKHWTPEGREHLLREDAIANWRKNNVSIPKDSPTGWAITPHLIGDVCPPYPLTTKALMEVKDDELVFGFAKRLLEKIPMAHWASITEMSPGLEFLPHFDHYDGFRTIHMPIYSPEEAVWVWYDREKNVTSKEHFPADGSIWSMNTYRHHGVINNSKETRVHLILIVEPENLDALYNLTGEI